MTLTFLEHQLLRWDKVVCFAPEVQQFSQITGSATDHNHATEM